jgi:hypothetical protein
MNELAKDFISFILENNGIGNKTALIRKAVNRFQFTQDRSIYYTRFFAVRFCFSSSGSFSNTVLSLSNLQKYDEMPFFICLVKKDSNVLYLANTTFLKKISHSSQLLRIDNIRGSFNGSDIVKSFNGTANTPENFEKLFAIHAGLGFESNLPRLVEATNNISPTGHKFLVDDLCRPNLLSSIERAISFNNSGEYNELLSDLDNRVNRFTNEIVVASLIDNVNIRGRVIEYLVAGEDEALRTEIVNALRTNANSLPRFSTENALGDYAKEFDNYYTETDVKTKIMVLNSNPKAYNIDKILEFLSRTNTVFMFYFIGIDPGRIANKILVSMFQRDILNSTILLKHWAGRNSRGVTQLEGNTIHNLILSPNKNIDRNRSIEFINSLINL